MGKEAGKLEGGGGKGEPAGGIFERGMG